MKKALVLLASVLALAAVTGGSVAEVQAAPAAQQTFYWVGYSRPEGIIVGIGGENRATVYAFGRAFNSGFKGRKVSNAYGNPMRVMWWHPQYRIALGFYAANRYIAVAANRAVAADLRSDGWVRQK